MKQALAVLAFSGMVTLSFAGTPATADSAKSTTVSPAAMEAVKTCGQKCGVSVSVGTEVNRPSQPRDFTLQPYGNPAGKASAGR